MVLLLSQPNNQTKLIVSLLKAGKNLHAHDNFRWLSKTWFAKDINLSLTAEKFDIVNLTPHSLNLYCEDVVINPDLPVIGGHTKIVETLVSYHIKQKEQLDKVFCILATSDHWGLYVGQIATLVVEDSCLMDMIGSAIMKDTVCMELTRRENAAVTFVAEQIQSRKNPLVRYLLHVMATMTR